MLTRVQPAECGERTRPEPLAAETRFYSDYDWSLDPHLTVGEAIAHLAGEIERLGRVEAGWQASEVAANVYLLSCSLVNGADEYLRGHTLRLPAQLARTRTGRLALWAGDQLSESLPKRSWRQVQRWKEALQDGLDSFFAALSRRDCEAAPLGAPGAEVSALLRWRLPAGLLDLPLGVPSAFSRLDLTHLDVIALGRQFMRQYPDKSQPVLFLGLRTAGTYFSVLLRSFFKAEGYQRIASVTVQPKKGASRDERRALARYAEQGFTVALVDDPPNSGSTIVLGIDIVRRAGFELSRAKVLVPTHPATRGWVKAIPAGLIVTLEPEQWRKQRLLAPATLEARLTEYFSAQGYSAVHVIGSHPLEEDPDGERPKGSDGKRGATLKRLFEVQLRTPAGECETRRVLATSVGLGYLGYPAFLSALRLSDFVPPLLGLRDGILYTEWLPRHRGGADAGLNRTAWITAAAAYVAARTRLLPLPKGRRPGKAVYENGWVLLAQALGRAYGQFALDIPMRPRIQQRLFGLHCPYPTLIDGNMGVAEWIWSGGGPLKTGFHGHGLGKTQLNVIDPACDLAEAILSFELSPEEETQLIDRYVALSGDVGVAERLFVHKLLIGLWTMESAQEQLFSVIQSGRQQQEQHRRFLGAWDFLSIQTARFCGARCRAARPASWRSPLVMLDIDGVIDRRIFGYPSTTAAGIEALSLLAKHGYAVALNTARSVYEVRDYCEAYGLAGGVAEHGAYLWDAIAQRGQPLIDQEAMAQLDVLRKELRQIPGVFLDERHRYSIRAYMIERKSRSLLSRLRSFNVGQGIPIPLPTLLANDLITRLQLDRLSFHQTTIDTAVVARGVDKGTGLIALRDKTIGTDAETIAIGDSEADLPMFREATRSFAPAQISCRREARLLGCAVSRFRYQRGLLDIVNNIVGGSGRRYGATLDDNGAPEGERLFLDLLRGPDRLQARALIAALSDRETFRMFTR